MPATPPQLYYILGLDLGQAKDPSALAVLEQSRLAPETPANYACRDLRRWPLGTPYPPIVAEVTKLASTPPLQGCALVIDGTGCGRPVVDLFRLSSINAGVLPVLITAGHAVSRDENGYYRVAKVQLVSVMQVLLGARRWKIAKSLPLTPTLEKELSTFTAKITTAGNETFAGDWRQGEHDDLVLAAAIAAWVGENLATGPFTVIEDRENRTILSRTPAGVFLDHREDDDAEDIDDDGERDIDIRWPW